MNSKRTITKRLHLGKRLRSCLFFFFNFCFNFFLTNKIFQDWIKEIYLESRAEIKLIFVFFCSESMTFVFSHSIRYRTLSVTPNTLAGRLTEYAIKYAHIREIGDSLSVSCHCTRSCTLFPVFPWRVRNIPFRWKAVFIFDCGLCPLHAML